MGNSEDCEVTWKAKNKKIKSTANNSFVVTNIYKYTCEDSFTTTVVVVYTTLHYRLTMKIIFFFLQNSFLLNFNAGNVHVL